MDDRVIHDIKNDVLVPHGRNPENFMMISQWGVRQEEVVKKGGYLEDIKGS